jgi:glycosyltransferase EpsD
MKNKILFVANIHKHFRAFHIPYIQYLQSKGYEVHVAANDGETKIIEADKQFNLTINRNPFSSENSKAIRELAKIIDKEEYCLVHCHTAMGSVVARIAAKKFRKTGLKVLYTAHGFHFYEGSPKKFWLMYYPMEKYLSKYTDGIITINQEDFQLLERKQFKNKHSFLINGVGVKRKKFNSISNDEKLNLRKQLGFSENDFILVYAAEYIHRKNHAFLIDSIKKLQTKIPNLKVLLAGRGQLFEEVKSLIDQSNLERTIIQLGFRTDIDSIYKLSDIGISTSRQEGLGLNLVEEMMCGLPVVATIDRGHKEVIDHAENGFLFQQNNHEQFQDYIIQLYNDKFLMSKMGEAAKEKAKQFELDNSLNQMSEIYQQFLPNKS